MLLANISPKVAIQPCNNEHNIIVLTLGILSLLQTPSERSLSLISHAKIDGHSLLNSAILLTTGCVATLGFEPPIALGLIDPVS